MFSQLERVAFLEAEVRKWDTLIECAIADGEDDLATWMAEKYRELASDELRELLVELDDQPAIETFKEMGLI